MNYLLKNIRFYVLVISVLIAGTIYFWTKASFPSDLQQTANFTQTYALTAVIYLYLAILATPLSKIFPSLPFKDTYLKAVRALGVSAMMFALIHAYFAFFGELGGFPSLPFLNAKYLVAITLSTIAFLFLIFLSLSSFDFVTAKISLKNRRVLGWLAYVALFLTAIHALMLGSAFTDLSGLIPQVFGTALAILLILEAIRLDQFLESKFNHYPKIGINLMAVVAVLFSIYSLNLLPSGITQSLTVHDVHKKAIAQLNAGTNIQPDYLKNMPGMQGDKTKRFTVDLKYPEPIAPGSPTKFFFKIYDASSGNQIGFFSKNYEKLMHMIIVDESLIYYNHIHPEFNNGGFEIEPVFPKIGRYHIYLDFQPTGAIEQQFAFNVIVGEGSAEQSDQTADQASQPRIDIEKENGGIPGTMFTIIAPDKKIINAQSPT